MKKIIITAVVLSVFLFTGCGIHSDINRPSDERLLKFLPVNGEEFLGDGDYYHVTKEIQFEKDDGKESAVITGEVKNNFAGGTGADYNFTIRLEVTSQELVQTYTGNRLNDSDFDRVILLKLPLEADQSWSFTATNKEGKKQKVTATITEIFNDGKGIKVRYETKDGYFEERTLYEKHGVIDFLRQVIYQNESTVTGYHSVLEIVKDDQASASSNSTNASDDLTSDVSIDATIDSSMDTTTDTQVFPMKVIDLPIAYYNLILGFEQAWTGYVSNSSDDLLKFVEPDTPAYTKMMEVDRSSDIKMNFVKYYPYEMTTENNYIVINIVETFTTEDQITIKNKVSYTISNADTIPKVYDFEVIK
ncbi:hypothetical protein [Fusibacter bizertensis]